MKFLDINGLKKFLAKLLEAITMPLTALAERIIRNEEHIKAIATPYLHMDGTVEYHLQPVVDNGVTILPDIYRTEGGCLTADYEDKEE